MLIAETQGSPGAAARNGRLDKKITVKYKKTSLGDALKDIGAKAGVRIAAEASVLSGQPPVKLEVTDEAAGRVLTRVLRRRGLKVKSYAASPLQVVRHNWHEPLAEKEEVYEFAKKPAVKNLGTAGFAIEFETKGFCDCTVAIVDAKGKTVRHLASGVLGVNAPKAFTWNSKQQRVVWDGEDDRGKRVTGPFTARVSLGLTARMERTLFWAPHKRVPGDTMRKVLPQPSIVARPEGVYVFDGAFGDHLKLFDRGGKYVRALFPPPADKVAEIKWPKLHPASTPKRPIPLKYSTDMITILTQGWADCGHPKAGWPTGNQYSWKNLSCSAMAIQGTRAALATTRLNRLSTDGSSPSGSSTSSGQAGSGQVGGLPLHGPYTWLQAPVNPRQSDYFQLLPQLWIRKQFTASGKHEYGCAPTSMAFSPDGKWLYATGYVWIHQGKGRVITRLDALPVVTRLAFEGKKRAEPWVGSPNPDGFGDGEKQLRHPIAVSTDSKGRVYVCDYMNSRVQVFSPEARLLGSLKTPYPADIKIHPRTGECYVFSWAIGNSHWKKQAGKKTVKPKLTRYGAFPEFKKGVSWPLPDLKWSVREKRSRRTVVNQASDNFPFNGHRVAIDFWSDPLRLWLFMPNYGEMGRTGGIPRPSSAGNVEIFDLGAGKPRLVCDFDRESRKESAFPRPCSGGGKMFVCADPVRGNLWVRNFVHFRHQGGDTVVCIDPETGRESLARVPIGQIADMAFDLDGYLYVRGLGSTARFDVSDPRQWREKPFKSGRKTSVGRFKAKSGIHFSRAAGGNAGVNGLGVSPRGHVVCGTVFEVAQAARQKVKYRPSDFPGRYGITLLWVFDRGGKRVCEDGFKGAGWMAGVKMDRDGYVYTAMMGQPLFKGRKGTRLVNRVSCTLMKFKPGEPRLFWEKGIRKPLPKEQWPKRPKEFTSDSKSLAWLEGVEWLVPEMGISGNKSSPRFSSDHGCICRNESRFDLDLYARSFCSEVCKYRVCVVDSNGNVMLRIGRMGNVDDGKPLVKKDRVPNPRQIGGDEVAIAHCSHVAVHTDKRLFVSDVGNACIRSVKLDYHASETVDIR